MRSPADMASRTLGSPRRRAFIVLFVIVAIVLLLSLRSLAMLWTTQLWFSSQGISQVFSTLLEVKLGLGISFGVLFFLILFGNLLLADRLGARDLSFDADDEVVRRFQEIVRPFARRAYAVVALIAGAVAGVSATSQWQNYLLFAHARSFHSVDPLFHKDLGFYIFRLPFLTFLVNWGLASLIVIIVVTTLIHYLNGGIRASRGAPRVSSQVKVHLSVLLAAVAVVKAVGYFLAKWQLVTSTNGYVEGAGYTDVHARMPALTILFILSLTAAGILLLNIRNRGWSLPALAVTLWVVVALVIGVIYPAALQAINVTPSQGTLERTFIARNIVATRTAFDLNNITVQPFTAANTITAAEVRASAATLNNVRIWDPAATIALANAKRTQAVRPYYTFGSLAVDRYDLNGKLTPVLVGARQINSSGIPAQTWVNTHLFYTHGIGAAMLPANQIDPTSGNPNYVLGSVPPTTSAGLAPITQPAVYFGIGLSGWVVADSKEKELNYENNSGPVVSHYKGSGGVVVGGLLRRMAFALRFGDVNFLISNQVTSKSRVMYVRNVLSMAQQAAPFISWDVHPYAVLADGHIDYVLDGYTTTNQYPYSQDASSQNVPSDNGLPASYNYVRNSVKLVINAYDGKMQFYAADPNDPILAAYRASFPKMFLPMSSMSATVRAHLRYPADMFSIQAATLGHYHIQNTAAFYSAADKWEISPIAGVGSPSKLLATTQTHDAQGLVTSSQLSPMDPVYQVMALPNSNRQQLVIESEYVPAGNASVVQGLTAFVTATMDPDNYGHLHVYVIPRGATVTGPAQADSKMLQTPSVSGETTLIDRSGTHAWLGNNVMIPVGKSVLYIRPLYVISSANPIPQLKFVIALLGQNVGFSTSLAGALSQVLGTSSGTNPPPITGHQTVKQYLADAASAYVDAQAALTAGNLATYQSDIKKMNAFVLQAERALAAGH